MGSLAYPMDTCGAVLSVVSNEHVGVWTLKLIFWRRTALLKKEALRYFMWVT